MVAVGNQCGAFKPLAAAKTNLSGELIAEKADHTRRRQRPEMRKILRVKETVDRLIQRHTRRNEDREDDEKPGELLASRTSQIEGNSERYSGQRIAKVVNQIRQQRDAVRRDEHDRLSRSRNPENTEADRHRSHTVPRPHDRAVDEAVRMTEPMVLVRLRMMPVRTVTVIVHMLVVGVNVTMICRQRQAAQHRRTVPTEAHQASAGGRRVFVSGRNE